LNAAVNGVKQRWPMLARRKGAMAGQKAADREVTDHQVLRELQMDAHLA
jgi:hypothetical protein